MTKENSKANYKSRNYCGLCQTKNGMKKYADYPGLDVGYTELYVCVHCLVVYNSSTENSGIDNRALQSKWDSEEFYEVPSTSEEFKVEIEEQGKIFEWLADLTRRDFSTSICLEIGAGSGMRSAGALRYFKEVLLNDFVTSRMIKTGYVLNDPRYQIIKDEDVFAKNVDVVLAWHVMEHVIDPAYILSQIFSVLNSDGIFFMQVPLLSERHVYPGHYWFYNSFTLQLVLSEVGFTKTKFFYDHEMCSITAVAFK